MTRKLKNFSRRNDKLLGTRGNGGSPIPKGLFLSAQGCEERATLGYRPQGFQPQRGCGTFPPPSLNPVGIVSPPSQASQGSSFLATLGLCAGIPLGFTPGIPEKHKGYPLLLLSCLEELDQCRQLTLGCESINRAAPRRAAALGGAIQVTVGRQNRNGPGVRV